MPFVSVEPALKVKKLPPVEPVKVKKSVPSDRKLILSSVQKLLSQLEPDVKESKSHRNIRIAPPTPGTTYLFKADSKHSGDDDAIPNPHSRPGLRRSGRIQKLRDAFSKLSASAPSSSSDSSDSSDFSDSSDSSDSRTTIEEVPKAAPGSWVVYRDLSKIYIGQLKMECKDGQFLIYSGIMKDSIFNNDYVSALNADIKASTVPIGPDWSLAEYVVSQRTIMGIFPPTVSVPRDALALVADFKRDPRLFPFK